MNFIDKPNAISLVLQVLGWRSDRESTVFVTIEIFTTGEASFWWWAFTMLFPSRLCKFSLLCHPNINFKNFLNPNPTAKCRPRCVANYWRIYKRSINVGLSFVIKGPWEKNMLPESHPQSVMSFASWRVCHVLVPVIILLVRDIILDLIFSCPLLWPSAGTSMASCCCWCWQRNNLL